MYKVKFIKTALVFALALMGMLITSPISHAENLKTCEKEALENSYNSFLESAAKSIEGFNIDTARVVELTESLPGGGNSEESMIIPAYKGTCCEKSNGESCEKTTNVYATTLTDCETMAGKGKCVPIQFLVSMTGINLLKFYVLQIYIWAASIVGIIAVLIIVISGIQIAASGGSDQISSAKTRITQSLAGLAILFLSALILYTINPTFFTK